MSLVQEGTVLVRTAPKARCSMSARTAMALTSVPSHGVLQVSQACPCGIQLVLRSCPLCGRPPSTRGAQRSAGPHGPGLKLRVPQPFSTFTRARGTVRSSL